jgi:hypothetical protein
MSGHFMTITIKTVLPNPKLQLRDKFTGIQIFHKFICIINYTIEIVTSLHVSTDQGEGNNINRCNFLERWAGKVYVNKLFQL